MISIDSLEKFLEDAPGKAPVYVAFSGGLDSHVLLHLLACMTTADLRPRHSLHVNHNFQAYSCEWAKHCRLTAEALGIEHHELVIDDKAPERESLEAWARDRRYKLMTDCMPRTAILLTAHHQDDQAETLLLQLLRGAGVNGLAAMPITSQRSGIVHGRPLLGFSREELYEYAIHHKLNWIEDESNKDTSFDRNFIRYNIIPRLIERWPSLGLTLTRVSAHQADAMHILEEVAEADYEILVNKADTTLSIEKLLTLGSARQSNLLRYWIKQQNLPIPASVHIENIRNELINAVAGRVPMVAWAGCEIRRHQGYIFATRPLSSHDNSIRKTWVLEQPCYIDNGELSAEKKVGRGLSAEYCTDARLEIRFRQGGEKIRLPLKKHRQDLKKLFQEAGVPFWLRDRVPLLYNGNRLVAVADMWIDADSQSKNNEQSWHLQWNPDSNYANIIRPRRGT